MSIEKITALQNLAKSQPSLGGEGANFKAILDSKRAAVVKPEDVVPQNKPIDFTVNKVISDVMRSHEKITQSIKGFISGDQHSPKEMLEIQYRTSEHFTLVQMMSKLGETAANTVKTVSQTQV